MILVVQSCFLHLLGALKIRIKLTQVTFDVLGEFQPARWVRSQCALITGRWSECVVYCAISRV